MAGKERMISKIAMIAIFLALIRTIAECFRLNYISKHSPTFEILHPFLIGALICSISCLTNCYFYNNHSSYFEIHI
jgi:hypothetical protein